MRGRVALVLSVATCFIGGVVLHAKHEEYRVFVEELSAPAGVVLGSTRTELLYERGQPTHVSQAAHGEMVNLQETPSSNPLRTYEVWAWADDEMVTEVSFRSTDRASAVSCYTRVQIVSGRCNTVGGVATSGYDVLRYLAASSEENALKALGAPDRISYESGEGPLVKVLAYDDLDLRLWFIRERLERI